MAIEMECVCGEYTHSVKESVYLHEEGGIYFTSYCPICGDTVKFFVGVELCGKAENLGRDKESKIRSFLF